MLAVDATVTIRSPSSAVPVVVNGAMMVVPAAGVKVGMPLPFTEATVAVRVSANPEEVGPAPPMPQIQAGDCAATAGNTVAVDKTPLPAVICASVMWTLGTPK